MPYRAISSYFSPGAAATRRPPAGRPARPAAGTLPPPAPGLGPRRIRLALGGGPRPGPVKPPLRGCAGRTRPQASWRAREGGAALPRAPGFRPRLPPKALGAAASSAAWNPVPGPGLPAGSEAGGPGERAGQGNRRWAGCAGPEPRLLARPLGPSWVWAAGGAAGWAESGASAAVSCGEGGGSWGDLRRFPPAEAAGAGYPGGRGTLEHGALPIFLQVRRRLGQQRRQFEEEGAKSFCMQE